MELGTFVDFCIEWNNIHNSTEEKKPTKREATQADWDSFWG